MKIIDRRVLSMARKARLAFIAMAGVSLAFGKPHLAVFALMSGFIYYRTILKLNGFIKEWLDGKEDGDENA